MSQDEIYIQLQKLAKENNVELTDNAVNIARFRARAAIPLDKCPCSPLDKERGCISKKCMDEIKTVGICHCQCYRRK